MRQTVFFLIKLAIVVTIAVWLAERPGQVEILWQGYQLETTVGILLLAVFLLMLIAAVAYRLWRGLVSAPGVIGRARAGSRRERGYRALTNGMVAIAAGDPEAARRFSRRAGELLSEPPMTMLLSAQTARLSGDDASARQHFEAMLDHQETEFLGLRGLLTDALQRQDWDRALRLAQRARTLRPETPWVLQACFDLEVRMSRWADAQGTLAQIARAGVVPRAESQRQKAAILLERSRDAEAAGDTYMALEHARQAASMAPGFIPAVIREAAMTAAGGQIARASKLLERAWIRDPHPEIADAYGLLSADKDEDELAGVQRLEKLHKLQPDAPAALVALAQAEMKAHLWGAARSHLVRAAEVAESRDIYRMLAELETAEKDDTAAARDWLVRSQGVVARPAWICSACGTVSSGWRGLCGHCGSFNTLEWRSPNVAQHLPARGDPPPLTAE